MRRTDNTSADHAHPTPAAANAIYVWYGNSDGSFSTPVVMTPSRNFYQLAAIDLDGDGRPDLVMSDGYVVSVQSNLGVRAYGAETHFLAGMGINSISAGDVNEDGFTDLIIANGGTVIANSAVRPATSMSDDVLTGGITVLLNTIKTNATHAGTGTPTTVVFTISTPSTIYFGQTVSGSAVVTASDGSTPTGTISFFDGTTNICTIAVTQAAICPASAGSGFAVGRHTLTAVYSGDSTHQRSTSSPVTVTVVPLAPTTNAIPYFGDRLRDDNGGGYGQPAGDCNSSGLGICSRCSCRAAICPRRPPVSSLRQRFLKVVRNHYAARKHDGSAILRGRGLSSRGRPVCRLRARLRRRWLCCSSRVSSGGRFETCWRRCLQFVEWLS